jgi:hypothetical protein
VWAGVVLWGTAVGVGAKDRASPNFMRLASLGLEIGMGLEIGIYMISYIASPIQRHFGARFLRASPVSRPQVGASRVAVGAHWCSDVCASTVGMWGLSQFVVLYHRSSTLYYIR